MASTHNQRHSLLPAAKQAERALEISEAKTSTASNEARPSSSTDGFFQTPPILKSPLDDDIALQRAAHLFLPDTVRKRSLDEIKALGDKALGKPVLDLVADAEKNLPYLKTWDAWGRRQDELVTSEGWRKLGAIGVEEGMVAMGYESDLGQFSRALWCLKYFVWCGSAVWTTCPNQMTDGVASLLRKHLSSASLDSETRAALQSAYDHTTSRDPNFAWTTGQWMTERQGGSDVSQTETLATYSPLLSSKDASSTGTDGIPLGPWLCNGFKWFSSATDSQMMVFLARTPKGISTFMAPMRRTIPETQKTGWPLNDLRTELNGVQIQRLKNKLGTRALPTAELVLKDVRAYLIGEEGKGVKEMATVLNISRVHNGITATGFWGRGLSIVRAFARVRKVGLKPLWTKPAFVRTLARMHVEYKANILLGAFVTSLLGILEQEEIAAYNSTIHTSQPSQPAKIEPTPIIPDPSKAVHLFRLLAPVLKGISGKAAIAGLQDCMECIGGVGYLESEEMQFNIARLYRDANVVPIWEGTTDMMADDVRRVVYGKTAGEVKAALRGWVENVGYVVKVTGGESELGGYAEAVAKSLSEFEGLVEKYSSDLDQYSLNARPMMERLADIVMGGLLVLDAASDGNGIALDALRAWFALRPYIQLSNIAAVEEDWQEVVKRDLRIVFGNDDPEVDVEMESTSKAKL